MFLIQREDATQISELFDVADLLRPFIMQTTTLRARVGRMDDGWHGGIGKDRMMYVEVTLNFLVYALLLWD